MTEPHQPHPVGDPVRAFRTALARARTAEMKVRALQAELDALKATQQQEDR